MASTIGLGLGVVDSAGILNKYNIKFNDIEDISYVEGITELAYTVIFNVLAGLDVTTGVGSRITGYIGSSRLAQGSNTSIKLALTEEMLAIENRIKALQIGIGDIPAEQSLDTLDILDIFVDFDKQTITIELRITNTLNQSVYVRI